MSPRDSTRHTIYAETIYRKLGIEPDQRLEKPGGVAMNLSDGGKVIDELF